MSSVPNIMTSIQQLVIDSQVCVIDSLFERLSVDMEMGEAEYIFTQFKSDLVASFTLSNVSVVDQSKKKACMKPTATASPTVPLDKVKKEKKPPTSYNIFIGLRLKELKVQYPQVQHDKIMKMIPKKTWDPEGYKEYEAANMTRIKEANAPDTSDTRLNELIMIDFMTTVTWVVPDMAFTSADNSDGSDSPDANRPSADSVAVIASEAEDAK